MMQKSKTNFDCLGALRLPLTNISIFSKNVDKNDFNEEISTLKETVNVMNSLAFHDNIITMRLKSSLRTIPGKKWYGITLEDV